MGSGALKCVRSGCVEVGSGVSRCILFPGHKTTWYYFAWGGRIRGGSRTYAC